MMLAAGVALLEGGYIASALTDARRPYDLEPLPVTPSVG